MTMGSQERAIVARGGSELLANRVDRTAAFPRGGSVLEVSDIGET